MDATQDRGQDGFEAEYSLNNTGGQEGFRVYSPSRISCGVSPIHEQRCLSVYTYHLLHFLPDFPLRCHHHILQ